MFATASRALLLLSATALLTLSGCKKDEKPADTTPTTPTGPTGVGFTTAGMSVLVDGTKWEVASNKCSLSKLSDGLNLSATVLSGSTGKGLVIDIPFQYFPGTYTAAQGTTGLYREIVGATSPEWAATGSTSNVKIIITSMASGKASGTFSFTGAAKAGTPATGTRTLTSGGFKDIPYTE
jgi:hypothetical protein